MELIDLSNPGDSVIVERQIAAPPDRVWSVWSDGERMMRWLGAVNFQPRPGGRLLLDQTAGATEADPRMIIFGRVTQFEPPQRIGFTWRGFMEDLRIWPAETQVELSVRDTADGCLVRLEHSGFDTQEGWAEPLYRAYHHCWVRENFFVQLEQQVGEQA